MNDNENKSIEQFMNEDSKKKKVQNWPHFVENEVIAFFNTYGIEKMSIEDGDGGKAKLTRTRDNGVKVDLTSTSVY